MFLRRLDPSYACFVVVFMRGDGEAMDLYTVDNNVRVSCVVGYQCNE